MINNNTDTNNVGNTIYMKEWFYSKNFTDCGDYRDHSCIIQKETEKAYQVRLFNINRSTTTWVPKSCTLTDYEEKVQEAEIAEQRRAEWEAKRQERWEAACKAYNDLIAYARANGVRGVREGLRRETIEQKIINAGIALPA